MNNIFQKYYGIDLNDKPVIGTVLVLSLVIILGIGWFHKTNKYPQLKADHTYKVVGPASHIIKQFNGKNADYEDGLLVIWDQKNDTTRFSLDSIKIYETLSP